MSRPRPQGTSQPPSKRAKLSQEPPSSGLEGLVNGTHGKKPQFSAKTNGVHSVRQDRADESRTVMAVGDGGRHGDDAMEDVVREEIVISSGEENSDDDSSDGDEEEEQDDTGAGAQVGAEEDAPTTKNLENDDVDAATEPTFGELLRAHAPDVIDVQASYIDPHADFNAVATLPAERHLSAPSGASLGTVLTQALKTNDRYLLESCFRFNELDSVRNTVERLPSNLVANLLQKLAERLHKRPGRAGHLMVWVQWVIIAHGAYLAGQPKVVKQLTDLNRVLKQRASGLQPLLSLKGRLDMLKAQVSLREDIQSRAAMVDEDDEPVIYVESREEEAQKQPVTRKDLILEQLDNINSSGDEMPTTMNDVSDSEADSQDSEDLIDDEAEETDDDSGDDVSGSESEIESDVELGDSEDISGSEEESMRTARPKALRRN
ncbi:NUC189-domain-containing protein [Lophium mytilinum]|uniref:NUC189-domain-containing protein n=1 Tax=Lophium mytilinum TaxID=390894 RepID=A0A6A6R200_9PEZI|nr:NUC189-domain-containing protein [Lophium mytilinum]